LICLIFIILSHPSEKNNAIVAENQFDNRKYPFFSVNRGFGRVKNMFSH